MKDRCKAQLMITSLYFSKYKLNDKHSNKCTLDFKLICGNICNQIKTDNEEVVVSIRVNTY